MDELVSVEAVVAEKTFVGKVKFPVGVPEGMIEWLQFPDDLVKYGDEMGLSHRDVKFILGALNGKWGLNADVNPTDLGPRIGMTFEEIDALTQQALAEATTQGITGKAVTPFLLARIKALTSGRSLATNIALVKHNAEVGARLALALAHAERGTGAA